MTDERFEGFDRISDVLGAFSGYGKIDPLVLQNAADRGTSVHKAIYAMLNDLGCWEERTDINGYIISFEKFWDDHKSPICATEERLFCHDLKITGAYDLIIKKTNPVTGCDNILIDWKTSTAPQKTWPLQGAAYTWLARKAGYAVDGCWFVKLDKLGREPKVFDYSSEYEENIKKFMACLDIYRTFFKDQKIPSFED